MRRKKRSKRLSACFYPTTFKQLRALSKRADRKPAVAVRLIVERACKAAPRFQYFSDLLDALDQLRPRSADPSKPPE
jgi:hypothetical protein